VSKDRTTRLGEGTDETKRLLRVAIARTIQTIDEFLNEARQLGAQDVVALTTSATREAENREEFLDGVRCKCGLEVQVITGEREAELIFRGVSSDPEWSGLPILVVDVGGGSAEFIQGQHGQIEQFRSLPLGAVRLTEQHGEDYAALMEFLRQTLRPLLKDYNVRNRKVIGTGGTITTMARIAAQASRPANSELMNARDAGSTADDHASLARETVRGLVDHLRALPLAERKEVPGLPPERADIIVAGGTVFLVAMELLGAAELTVSVRNLRYGALVG
jgi:exopolyphosphatase/guanosine-5'-triphosphate,3'-diphosphate pyrophosphatase